MPTLKRRTVQLLTSTTSLSSKQVKQYWDEFCEHYGVTDEEGIEACAAFVRALTETRGKTQLSEHWRPSRETLNFIEQYGYPITSMPADQKLFSLNALVSWWVFWLKDEGILPRFPDRHFAYFVLYRESLPFSVYLATIKFYENFELLKGQGDQSALATFVTEHLDWREPPVFLASKLIDALFQFGYGETVENLVPMLPGRFNDQELAITRELTTPKASAAIDRCRDRVTQQHSFPPRLTTTVIGSQHEIDPYDEYLGTKGQSVNQVPPDCETPSVKPPQAAPKRSRLWTEITESQQGRVDPKTGKYVKSETDLDNDRRAGLLSQAELKQLLNYMVKIKGQFPDMDATTVKFHALNQLAKDTVG